MPADVGRPAAQRLELLDSRPRRPAVRLHVEWRGLDAQPGGQPEGPFGHRADKQTGKLMARDHFGIGADIIHGQWSSLALGVGRAGRAVLRCRQWLAVRLRGSRFQRSAGRRHAAAAEAVWQTQRPSARTNARAPTARTLPQHAFLRGHRLARLLPESRVRGFHPGAFPRLERRLARVSRRHAIGRHHARAASLWSYDKIAASISTVAIHDGLVYAAGFDGRLHCLDAETGRCYWVHDAGKPIWGSPLVADGKVYLGTGAQVLWVLAAGKELKVISRIRMRDGDLQHAHGRQWHAVRGHEQALVCGGEGLGGEGRGNQKLNDPPHCNGGELQCARGIPCKLKFRCSLSP